MVEERLEDRSTGRLTRVLRVVLRNSRRFWKISIMMISLSVYCLFGRFSI